MIAGPARWGKYHASQLSSQSSLLSNGGGILFFLPVLLTKRNHLPLVAWRQSQSVSAVEGFTGAAAAFFLTVFLAVLPATAGFAVFFFFVMAGFFAAGMAATVHLS